MQTDIYNLIVRTGRAATLKKKASGTYTPGTGLAGDSETTYSVKCKLVEYADKLINGTTIKQSDRKALIAAKGLAVVPDENDLLTDNGITYNILRVQKIEQGSTVIAYACQVRV